MICDEDADPLATLELIDDIKRLGLGHHFKEDISNVLDRMLSTQATRTWLREKRSLHAIALHFRLCREHGYEISQGTYIVIEESYLYIYIVFFETNCLYNSDH